MAPVLTCEQITVEVSLSRRPRTNDYRITPSHTPINQPTWRRLIRRKRDSCSPVGTVQEEEGPLTPTSKCLWGSGSGVKELQMHDPTRVFTSRQINVRGALRLSPRPDFLQRHPAIVLTRTSFSDVLETRRKTTASAAELKRPAGDAHHHHQSESRLILQSPRLPAESRRIIVSSLFQSTLTAFLSFS